MPIPKRHLPPTFTLPPTFIFTDLSRSGVGPKGGDGMKNSDCCPVKVQEC